MSEKCIAQDRDEKGHQHRGEQADAYGQVDAGLCECKAPLEAQGHEQIERQKLCHRFGNLQIGTNGTRKDTKYEEQNGRIEKVLHEERLVETCKRVKTLLQTSYCLSQRPARNDKPLPWGSLFSLWNDRKKQIGQEYHDVNNALKDSRLPLKSAGTREGGAP